jgi:3-oxoacyl-[acyl-carrier protein] reductase
MNTQSAPRELEGTAAIVTGSAKNMGRMIALTLAEAGAAVLINARTSADAARSVAEEVEAAGGRAIVHMADVTRRVAVEGWVAAAVAAIGRLDILVNNVGIRLAKPITEVSFEDWRSVQAGTLDAAFLCTRASVPHLARHGRGAIVNIGGVSGHAGVANRSPVAAAKAGLAGFTGSLGVELAPLDITVNCVAPGHIAHAGEPGRMSAHFRERPIPVGRDGRPEDIADLVRLLCGPSGRYTTGQTFHVNGGWYVTIA